VVASSATTPEVSITEARARLSALLRQAEVTNKPISITRRGKVVAVLSPVPGYHVNIATELYGLFADHPEVCDEIDKVYAERCKHKARYVEF
jgi:prevent-host-death family protein